MRRTKPPPERRDDRTYAQLWRVVDGAVADAMQKHPEYFQRERLLTARISIAKRVVGAVLGYAEQSARSRSGAEPAADTAGELHTPPRGDACEPTTSPLARTVTARSRRGRHPGVDPVIMTAILRDDQALREIARTLDP